MHDHCPPSVHVHSPPTHSSPTMSGVHHHAHHQPQQINQHHGQNNQHRGQNDQHHGQSSQNHKQNSQSHNQNKQYPGQNNQAHTRNKNNQNHGQNNRSHEEQDHHHSKHHQGLDNACEPGSPFVNPDDIIAPLSNIFQTSSNSTTQVRNFSSQTTSESAKKPQNNIKRKQYGEITQDLEPLQYPHGRLTHVSLKDANGELRDPQEILKDIIRERKEVDLARGVCPSQLYSWSKTPIKRLLHTIEYRVETGRQADGKMKVLGL